MQLHQLQPKTHLKREKRVGRGGKRGKTSGRGTKGQRARAGAKIRPALRDVIKKLPKKRGWSFRGFRPRPAVVSLDAIEKHFSSGAIITPASLLEKNLIRKMKGRMPQVKILAAPALRKKFNFRGILFSAQAQRLVQAAGGTTH
ncbi:MAG: 50S ribosomal protein L15 [Patescibacteria group bacterium]